jgi:hypothetical protein
MLCVCILPFYMYAVCVRMQSAATRSPQGDLQIPLFPHLTDIRNPVR